MFVPRSSAIEFVALIFVALSLPFYVESVTLQGKLRNYAFNTKCLHAVGGDNGAELEIVDCSDASTIIEASGFQAGSFQLRLKETGKCLTAEDGLTHMYQWDCAGTQRAPHQSWTLDVIRQPPQVASFKGRLRNYAFNSKCLNAVGWDNGAELNIVDCSDSNQALTIRTEKFKNMANEAAYIQFDVSQKCVSLNGFAGDNGVHLLIWDCVDQDNQKFTIVNGQLSGPFQLKLQQTGKCLTAEDGGTYVDQWDCVGTTDLATHQSWTLDILDALQIDYKGVLRNYGHNTKCLHAVGGDNGAELEIVDCSAANQDQLVRMDNVQNMKNEAGYVKFDASGKCLSLNGFAGDNGVHILIWDCVDQDNQKWKMIDQGKGQAFQLQLKSTGKCLTAENGGVFVDQWDCVSSIDFAPHQSWTIDKISPNTFYL